MTQLLQQAWSEIQKLPEPAQDAIVAIILDELEDDRRWEDAFANSQEKLARLAERVISRQFQGM